MLFISVSLEFSTNHGRSWSLLHTECLPELCAGPHLPHSTIYSSDNYSGYKSVCLSSYVHLSFVKLLHFCIFFSSSYYLSAQVDQNLYSSAQCGPDRDHSVSLEAVWLWSRQHVGYRQRYELDILATFFLSHAPMRYILTWTYTQVLHEGYINYANSITQQ